MKKDEITLKNTKTEILDALNAALEREKSMSSVKYDPEKEEVKKQKEKAIELTKDNVEKNVFSEDLNNKFKNLEFAIKAEEEKLKELYGIEKELSSLVVVINAGKDYMLELESKKKDKLEKFNEVISQLDEEYKSKNATLVKDYEAKSKELKVLREREDEEYKYKLKRDREITNNKWEDEKALRESVLSQKEKETDRLLEEAKGKVEYLKELEDKVKEIPELLNSEYTRGREDAIVELEKENNFSTELLKKDFQNVIERQNYKIEILEDKIKKYEEEKLLVQSKLDQAYIQIKDMATKTVETAGVVKIIGNTVDSNKD